MVLIVKMLNRSREMHAWRGTRHESGQFSPIASVNQSSVSVCLTPMAMPMVIHGRAGGIQVKGLISPYENRVLRASVGRVSYGLSTYLDSEHNLSVTQTPAMKRLGCRWVDTCASSSDASPLYIHDRSNVVQWKGSSLPSSQCTPSDQCIFGKMCLDESRTEIFHRNTRHA